MHIFLKINNIKSTKKHDITDVINTVVNQTNFTEVFYIFRCQSFTCVISRIKIKVKIGNAKSQIIQNSFDNSVLGESFN